MKRIFFTSMTLIVASFFMVSCEPAANNANRPANAPANNANAATLVNTAAIEAEIKKLVADVGAAMGRNDADALDRMNSDNFMVVNPSGVVQDKAGWSASFRSGDLKFDSFVYDEINVRVNTEGTGAVAISRATAKGTAKGQPPIDTQVRVTSVWSKTKDGWKAVSAHATRIIGDPAGQPAANTANVNRAANTAKSPGPANK